MLHAEIRRLAEFISKVQWCCPCKHLYTRIASLKLIRSAAISQCSWRRSRVMWSYLDEENTSRAAEFITDWSRYCRIPAGWNCHSPAVSERAMVLMTGTWFIDCNRSACVWTTCSESLHQMEQLEVDSATLNHKSDCHATAATSQRTDYKLIRYGATRQQGWNALIIPVLWEEVRLALRGICPRRWTWWRWCCWSLWTVKW